MKEAKVQIISPSDLHAVADQVAIIDARQAGFIFGHIPHSQPMMWQDFTEEKPSLLNYFFGHPAKWGKVRNDKPVEQKLRQLGLSNDGTIVVVGSPNGWGEEGRIAWNLLYWGAKNVALLDGGFLAWKATGYPVQVGFAKPQPFGNFNLNICKDRRAAISDVKESIKTQSRHFLDARSKAEFEGKAVLGQKRGGRIPGASLIEFKNLYLSDGSYVNASELQALIGGELLSSPIAYCTGGVRSALLSMLIEARLGIRTANYDASMWEWSRELKLSLQN